MPRPIPEDLLSVLTDGCVLNRDVSLAALSSFRTGGTAAYTLSPKTPEAFARALKCITDHAIPYYLLGRGTNVLCPDEGFDGIILLTDELKGLSVKENIITCEAGVPLNTLARTACDAALTGLEFAFGIPGTLGGAIRMNAGAYEHAIGELSLTVTACDRAGRLVTIDGNECGFGYRESIFQKEKLAVLSAAITLEAGDREAIRAQMEDYLSRRKKSQPLEYPSAGSFFRRPTGYFAGKLIQDAGLKGTRVGDAAVSEKHAGFLINLGHATTGEVKALAEKVQAEVKKQSGVELKREVIYLGEDDD